MPRNRLGNQKMPCFPLWTWPLHSHYRPQPIGPHPQQPSPRRNRKPSSTTSSNSPNGLQFHNSLVERCPKFCSRCTCPATHVTSQTQETTSQSMTSTLKKPHLYHRLEHLTKTLGSQKIYTFRSCEDTQTTTQSIKASKTSFKQVSRTKETSCRNQWKNLGN